MMLRRLLLTISVVACSWASAFGQPFDLAEDLEMYEDEVVSPESRKPATRSLFLRELRIGLAPAWSYYSEQFTRSQVMEDLHLDSLVGMPKSDEYGPYIGICFDYLKRRKNARSGFYKPHVEIILGPSIVYDGSSQADDTIIRVNNTDIRLGTYTPIRDTKANIFFKTSAIFGYSYRSRSYELLLGTGLDIKWWKRFLTPDFSETYTWYGVPLMLATTLHTSPISKIGFSATCNLMVIGDMQLNFRGTGIFNVPRVKLGNTTGAKFELFYSLTRRPGVAIRFVPYYEFYGFLRSNNIQLEGYDENGVLNTYTLWEPTSKTWWAGLRIQYEFTPGNRREHE